MNLEQTLSTTTTLLQLAPSILQLMLMVEQAFKNTQNAGVQKKTVVLSAIPSEVKVQAGAFIDTTIAALNSSSQVVKAL